MTGSKLLTILLSCTQGFSNFDSFSRILYLFSSFAVEYEAANSFAQNIMEVQQQIVIPAK